LSNILFLVRFWHLCPPGQSDITVWSYIICSEHKSCPFPPALYPLLVHEYLPKFLNFVFILRVHILYLIGWKTRMFSLYLLSTIQATPNFLLRVFAVCSSVRFSRSITASPCHLVSCMAITCMLHCFICGMNSLIDSGLSNALTFHVPYPDSLASLYNLLIPILRLWLKFHNKYVLLGGVVCPMPNTQLGGLQYPSLSGSSLLTYPGWEDYQ
jgi:hypothetical protein